MPLKLYFANLVLLAPSLLVDINVNAALSAGLDASAGSILKVDPPEDTRDSRASVVFWKRTITNPNQFGLTPAPVQPPANWRKLLADKSGGGI